MVYRIYVEKKPGFDVEATGLKNELTSLLGIKELSGLRLLNRYDVEGIDEELFNQCADTVFSEPPVDNTYAELPASDGVSFAVEYLPGQFDQRADSAAECIQLISQGERPLVRSARVYLLEGCLLYTSDAADEEDSGDLGGRRIIKKKKVTNVNGVRTTINSSSEEMRR